MDPTDADEQLTADEARLLLAEVRAANEADLAAAREKLDGLADDGSGSSDNMSDVVTTARFMLDDAGSILVEVAAAEDRIEAGTYGVCEGCGGRIASGRLRLRPYVRRCVSCAS